MLFSAKVTSKGQVTIPKGLRKKIGIETGSYIEIEETENGYLIRKKVDDDVFKKYIGLLKNKKTSEEVIKELRGD